MYISLGLCALLPTYLPTYLPAYRKSGRLYLVDLAGSERIKKSAVTGAELKEAQHINK